MPILDLRFTHIGPFDDIAFEFDEHVNVFVGPNNSGKSTVLMVLGDITVYPFGIPRKLRKEAPAEFMVHIASNDSGKKALRGPIPVDQWFYEDEKREQRYLAILREIGYTSFVPALRQSTDFRSEGPIVKKKRERSIPSSLGQRKEIEEGDHST